MALPTAVQNSLEKLRQGPVEIVFDPDGDAVSLFARGGVDVAFLRGREEAELDLLGVHDLYTTGDGAEFELALPERSLDVLGCLFPEGVSGTASGATYRGFGSTAGQSVRANALQVCLEEHEPCLVIFVPSLRKRNSVHQNVFGNEARIYTSEPVEITHTQPCRDK